VPVPADSTLLIYALIGLAAGFMTGMFGIGGGSIRIPLLYVYGLPLLSAFAVNVFVVPFSSVVGAISHRKNIAWTSLPNVALGGTVGSMLGALLVGLIPPLGLAVLFLALSALTIAGMFADRFGATLVIRQRENAVFVVTGTFVINLMTGMRGGSGGSLLPPLLRLVTGDVRHAIATALATTTVTAGAAAVIYWNRGDILWPAAIATMIGSILGSRFGSRLSLRTRPRWLEIGLAATVLAMALVTVFKATA
jgi:uncharacterized membrane protein YfcA